MDPLDVFGLLWSHSLAAGIGVYLTARLRRSERPAEAPVPPPPSYKIGNVNDPAFARAGDPAAIFEGARNEERIRARYACSVCREPSVIQCPACRQIVCLAHSARPDHTCRGVLGEETHAP